MEILGIGPLEVLFILLIALIAVGPKDLGKAARSMGRLLNQLYKSEAWQNLGEASRNIRSLPQSIGKRSRTGGGGTGAKGEMKTSGIDKIKSFDFESDQPEDAELSSDQPEDAELTPDQPKDAEPNTDPPLESPSPEEK